MAVPTPLTAGIIARIHDIEEGRRGLVLANLEELAALPPETVS